ncbi:integrase [Actinosynnema sp. NPDC023794]
MLLRLAYLSVTNAFVLLRLLPLSAPDRDVEILALRHQITILERQLGSARPRFSPADRMFPAALLHRFPGATLHRLRLLVRPETVLRWHRDLLARRQTARSRPKRPGRPRTVRLLVLRLAQDNPTRGYRRIHGELLVLGITVAASTVWQILKDAGIDPAPERASTTWSAFLRSQADALLACDFFKTSTLSGTRQPPDPRARRHRTPDRLLSHPSRQEPRHGLEDAGSPARFLIRDRDRDGKYPALLDAVHADAGIRGRPRQCPDTANERDHGALDPELPTRTARPHTGLKPTAPAPRPARARAVHNTHRPHQGIANARPLHPLPPATDKAAVTHLDIRRRPRLGGILNEDHHAA